MGASKLPKSLFDLRRVSENPAVHRAVIDLEAAFKEHALEITIAQRIAQIPCHRLHDQPRLEMTPLEIVLGLTFQFLGNRVQITGSLPNSGSKIRRRYNHPVNPKKFATAPSRHEGDVEGRLDDPGHGRFGPLPGYFGRILRRVSH